MVLDRPHCSHSSYIYTTRVRLVQEYVFISIVENPLKAPLTRRHRNDRLPGRPRAAAPEPRVKAGPRLEQVLAAGVAQRLQVRHEAEVGQREVRTGEVAEARGGEVRVEHVERGRRAW